MPIIPPTTCIGVDITWWGGRKRSRASRRETIVAIRLDARPSIAIEMVDLSPVPNPSGHELGEANYDRDGAFLVDALMKVIEQVAAEGDRVIVALDAPLEAMERTDQKPRRKAVPRGESMGSKRRECETHMSLYTRSLPKKDRSGMEQRSENSIGESDRTENY